MTEQSNIVIAIDAELNVLDRRVTKLRELRRLAVELDGARLPRAAAAAITPSRERVARQPALTVADVLDATRDLLADGPTTVSDILRAVGRSNGAHARDVAVAALEQLGAVDVAPNARGRRRYVLPPEDPNPLGPQDPEAPEFSDESEQLHAIVRGILQRQVDCTDEEIRYQLRKRHGIDISLVDAHREHELAKGRGGGIRWKRRSSCRPRPSAIGSRR